MSTTTYSPSINAPNVLLNNVSSSKDLVYQSWSIVPTTSNLSPVNQWVQKLTNTIGLGAAYQPSWATITANSYSAVACSAKNFYGGVLLPDGRVVFIPQSSSNVGIFYTSNNTYTNAVSIGTQYNGGCLLPDGRVAICPYTPTTWAVYNPANNTVAQYGTVPATSQFVSCVLGADGNAYSIGVSTGYIGIFNPKTNTATTYATGLNPQGNKGVLMPDGRIIWGTGNQSYLVVWNPATWTATSVPPGGFGSQRLGAVSWVPQGYSIFFPLDTGGSNICTYNPTTSTFSNLMSGWSSNFRYTSSAVLPSGLVVLIPYWANYIGFFNPVTNTVTTLTPATSLGATNQGLFEHSVLLPDGRLIFVPQTSTTIGILNTGVPAPADFCLHPIYNRC
jgi:streptogramin lyase